jgi:Phosphotransferase enzyme family
VSAVAATASPLDALLDADAVAPALRAGLRLGTDVGVVSIRPIVWKPESRALIAYTLEGAAARVRVYGKHFANPERGARLYHTWLELQTTDFGPTAGVPRVEAWLPELSMVVYIPARGRPLDAGICAEGTAVPMRAAGEWLARLHSSSVRPARRFDLGRELANLRRWAERVAAIRPAHAASARRLVRGLEHRAREIPLAADVPIHKDFHYRHVVFGRRLTVLDFDEVRMGDPSFDLAHFCTYLVLLGARSRYARSRLPSLEREFLQAYAEHTGWTPDGRFEFFSAYTCVKIAKQLAQGTGVDPRPHGRDRDRQLGLILEHGCGLCGGGA